MILSFVTLFLAVGVYASISYASYQPFAQIEKVTISGQSLVKEDEVHEKVIGMLAGSRWGSISKNTLLTAPLGAIESTLLDAYPQLRSATIERHFLTKEISIHLTEHVIYAIWCANDSDSCYYMTRDGYVFSPAQADPLLVKWYSPLPTDPMRANIGGTYMPQSVALVDGVKGLGLRVERVDIEHDGKELRVGVGSWYIRVSSDMPVDATIRYIKAGLQSKEMQAAQPHLEYLDARFGNRLYFKEKPLEQELVVPLESEQGN